MSTRAYRRTLIGLAFAALAVLAAFLAVSLLALRDDLLDAQRALHRHLARELVDRMVINLHAGSDAQDLERQFAELMVVNPSIELYLLDPEGWLMSWSATPESVHLQRVDLEPVRRFLAGHDDVLGDDPRDPVARKPFSVAAIQVDGRLIGYLYVILTGGRFRELVGELGVGEELRLSLFALGLSLLAVGVLGATRYALQSRRLRRLAMRMQRFERKLSAELGAEEPVSPLPSGDELEKLEATFEVLRQHLSEQVRIVAQNDSLRRELVAHVSHDLRTPLAALQGYLETVIMMRDGLSAAEITEYLEAAAKHAQRVATLVDDLLELARLESPEFRIELEAFSLADLVQDVIQKFRLRAAERGIELEARLAGALPLAAGDIGLVERALENLIENALRHTAPGGSVTLDLRRRDPGLEVNVVDTGCGIPPEWVPRIFEPFFRGEGTSDTDGRPGVGLGLAIVRRVAELHGGMVHAESSPGGGTTFRLRLPLAGGSEGARAD